MSATKKLEAGSSFCWPRAASNPNPKHRPWRRPPRRQPSEINDNDSANINNDNNNHESSSTRLDSSDSYCKRSQTLRGRLKWQPRQLWRTTASISMISINLSAVVPFVFFLVLFCHIQPAISSGLKLNDFITHFEPAYFSLDHVRIKRDIPAEDSFDNENDEDHELIQHWKKTSYHHNSAKPISFNVTAHNRLFQINLHPFAQEVFADDVVLETSEGLLQDAPKQKILNKVYSGTLADLPTSSSVHGIFTKDGLFDGHIVTPDESYYIEPAARYFENGSVPFHSVIFKASDVVHPMDDELNNPCKSHELHLKKKEEEKKRQNGKSFKPVISRPKRSASTDEAAATMPKFENLAESSHMHDGSPVITDTEVDTDKNGWSIRGLRLKKTGTASKQVVTTYEIVDWADVPESVKHHFRKRNEARLALAEGRGHIDQKKKTCMLYLQADHLFYEAMGSEEACIEAMTRHVQRVNSIYKPIDFDGDGKADNISFMIKRIKVHTSKALDRPGYRFPGNYGVEKFLEIFSEENYDAFCLAYMFTYRDFEGGTLGLAWTGDMKNAGGVCERNGHYRGTLKSLNTGIITLLNYGKHVPPAVSHVTMAHEMGHNFGSPHDPENNKACVPGGEDGNYIMFARATSGDKKNNRKFSPCSLKSIKPVLLTKARGPKGCFTEPKMALCGNGVVEEGEQCDCGWEEDCEEDCCWPQRTDHPANEKPCTLKPKRDCSPSQGPCCTNTCQFKLGDKCLDDNGCREESFCDGTTPSCPLSEVKPNKTVCNEEFVCYKGECTGSICLAYGLESCQCTQGPEDAPTKACELCCKKPGDDQPCLSSFELNEKPFDIPDMFSKPGTPCNNYAGYCDVFQKCRQVDPSGPLATLRKLLLSDESIASLKKFLMRYWYSVVFIVLGVFLLMAAIIKLCGKKTPLVTARRRKRRRHTHHNNDDSAVNIEAGGVNDVQVHPTTIEPSVPLGKKVRKGENRSKNKSKSKTRSKSKSRKSSTNSSPTSGGPVISSPSTEVSDEVAARLAANLDNRLFVDLPPEAAHSANMASRPPMPLPTSASAGALHQGSGQNNSSYSPTKSKSAPRASRSKSKSKKSASSREAEKSRRMHKSLSPEKRLKSSLAHSMSSISKSFEKLDMSQPRNGRSKGGRRKTGEDGKKHGERNQRRRSRPNKEDQQENTNGGKEVTLAKLGRFKFSLEVKQNGLAVAASNSEADKKDRGGKRKVSAHKQEDNNAKPQPSTQVANNTSRKEQPTTAVTKLPSIHVTNFNAQQKMQPMPSSAEAVTTSKAASFKPPPSVIVSKKREKERPRASRENRESQSPEKSVANLDYRKSFTGGNNSKTDRFARSVSVPGPTPPDLEEILLAGEPSYFGQQANKKNQLRRSETERFMTASASNSRRRSSNGDLAWDNQGYEKSPEPTSGSGSPKEEDDSSSSSGLKVISSSRSSSLSSMSASASGSGSASASGNAASFGIETTSSDSDLEITGSKNRKPETISRARILETVGVIMPKSSNSNNANGSAANLLLPPSSSSSPSSPSTASSVSFETGSAQQQQQLPVSSSNSSEPTLAFIGCDPPGGGRVEAANSSDSTKRPSLSERYPTSASSVSSNSKDNGEDNMDVISIID